MQSWERKYRTVSIKQRELSLRSVAGDLLAVGGEGFEDVLLPGDDQV